MNAYITRIAAYLPNAPVSNDEIENVLGLVNQKPSRSRRIVLRNNGIQQRHYVICPTTGTPKYSNASLTAGAIRKLFPLPQELEQVECLSVGTSNPDQLLPNHGVMVHGELGNPACEVVATAGICLAGTTALKYAWMSVLTGQCSKAVATGSEVASLNLRAQRFDAETDARILALEENPELAFEKDFLRWMLSDAAGAMLIEPTPNTNSLSLRIDWIDVFSYAHEMPVCMYAGAIKDHGGTFTGWSNFDHEAIGAQSVMALKQDVKLLNANVVEYCLVKPLQSIQEKRQLKADDINWFLPHMSSYFFEQPIAEGLSKIGLTIPKEKWFTNLKDRGNTGSASIYLMLEELFNHKHLAKGQTILCFVPESGLFSSAYIHLTVV